MVLTPITSVVIVSPYRIWMESQTVRSGVIKRTKDLARPRQYWAGYYAARRDAALEEMRIAREFNRKQTARQFARVARQFNGLSISYGRPA